MSDIIIFFSILSITMGKEDLRNLNHINITPLSSEFGCIRRLAAGHELWIPSESITPEKLETFNFAAKNAWEYVRTSPSQTLRAHGLVGLYLRSSDSPNGYFALRSIDPIFPPSAGVSSALCELNQIDDNFHGRLTVEFTNGLPQYATHMVEGSNHNSFDVAVMTFLLQRLTQNPQLGSAA